MYQLTTGKCLRPLKLLLVNGKVKELISVIPRLNEPVPRGVALREPDRSAAGCPFRKSCELACAECAEHVPEMRELSPGHFVRCGCV